MDPMRSSAQRPTSVALRRACVLTAVSGVLAASFGTVPATATAECSPTVTVLTSPFGPGEVQSKAINDRGDIVGFATVTDPATPRRSPAIHAVLWKHGRSDAVVDLGVLPGYVSSEAYGVNNDRIVVGLLYDKRGRTFPFHWERGHMTVLKGPRGHRRQAQTAQRNSINNRGQIAGTLVIRGQLRAVRWSPSGRARMLGTLPGHAWSYAFGINDDGLVSGWSRRKPSSSGAENPVVWPRPGKVVALQTAPDRADGIAEATNSHGLSVGYLGNQTPKEPERDEARVWSSHHATPRLLASVSAKHTLAELVDVNDQGQAAGMSGTFVEKGGNGFPSSMVPAVWQKGWASLRALPLPPVQQGPPVVIATVHDINAEGVVVGDVFRLDRPDPSALRSIDPVVWTCAFATDRS